MCVCVCVFVFVCVCLCVCVHGRTVVAVAMPDNGKTTMEEAGVERLTAKKSSSGPGLPLLKSSAA